MRTHQAHYIQPNPTYRQNAHINAQLIKNNNQTSFSNRVKSLSPPQMIHQNGMNYQPIQKMNASPSDHNKISFGQFKQGMNIQNNNHFLGVQNNIVAPAPTNVIKIEKVNRSNSSSRVVSQQSRISYLNVNGDSQTNNNTNKIAAISSPQLVNKNILPITSRPPSNLSSNSVQPRPFSPKPITVVQNSQQITYNNIPIAYNKPINTNFPISQRKPTMPYIQNIQNPLPKTNILNHHNNQMFQHINHNRISQHRILPNPIPSNLDLHTSQVKIVYQRGSYSPNQNQSNQQSRNIIQKQRNLSPPIPNQYQIQPPIKFQQPAIKNKQDKISITNLKQEKNSRNNQLHKNQVRLNGNTIKSTPVQSIIVNKFIQKSSMHIVNTNKIQGEYIINKSRQNNLVINNKNQLQYHDKNQYTSKPNQNPAHIINYSQKQNPNRHKSQTFNLNSNIYKQQTVKQTQSKNITNSISSPYLNSSPRYVYKSYDEYLQQTTKPKQQIKQIQQIQQSQLQTVINIQYKNIQRQHYVGNHQSTPNNNKNEQLKRKQQINSEQSVKIDQGYGHRSIPIPTIYGEDIDDSNEGHSLNKNLQNQRKIGASQLKSSDQANLSCQIIQQNTSQQILFSNQTHHITKMHNQDYLASNQNKNIITKPQQTTKSDPKSQTLQLPNPIPNLKSIRNSPTSNPPSSNNQNSNNISTIRQQTNQYQNDYQYQYSSSLIGQSLQQNLRQVGSSGRLISQYQPDSWGHESNQQQKIGIMKGANRNNSHNSINNYSNTLLNHINIQNTGNQSSQTLPTNKINPFIMIQQQNKQKITKQNIKGNQNMIVNRQYQNNKNIQQKNNKIQQYQYTNLSTNKKQNTITKQKISIAQNQQINKQIKYDYSNNRLDIKYINNFNNQHKNQNDYREYVKAGFHIVSSVKQQQQNGYDYKNLAAQNVQLYNKFDKNNDNNINVGFRRQDNNQRKYQLSDASRINSQKIINISPNANVFIPSVSTNPNIPLQTNNYRPSYHTQRYSYQNIQPQPQDYYHNNNHVQAYTHTHTHSYNNVNRKIKNQIQNQQQYQAQQPSLDVYDLIDNIYNRQLENGLARIRQVFGNAISTGVRGTY